MKRAELGNRIKKYRYLSKVTQRELAELLSVDPSAISHYENGRRQPDIEQIGKMKEIFEKAGISSAFDDLFRGNGEVERMETKKEELHIHKRYDKNFIEYAKYQNGSYYSEEKYNNDHKEFYELAVEEYPEYRFAVDIKEEEYRLTRVWIDALSLSDEQSYCVGYYVPVLDFVYYNHMIRNFLEGDCDTSVHMVDTISRNIADDWKVIRFINGRLGGMSFSLDNENILELNEFKDCYVCFMSSLYLGDDKDNEERVRRVLPQLMQNVMNNKEIVCEAYVLTCEDKKDDSVNGLFDLGGQEVFNTIFYPAGFDAETFHEDGHNQIVAVKKNKKTCKDIGDTIFNRFYKKQLDSYVKKNQGRWKKALEKLRNENSCKTSFDPYKEMSDEEYDRMEKKYFAECHK